MSFQMEQTERSTCNMLDLSSANDGNNNNSQSNDDKRRRPGVAYWSLPQGDEIRRQLLQKPRPLSTPNLSEELTRRESSVRDPALSASSLAIYPAKDNKQSDKQQPEPLLKNKAKTAKNGPRTVIKKILQRRTNEVLNKVSGSVRNARSRSLPTKIPLPLHTAILHGTYTDLFSLLAKDKYIDINQSDSNNVSAVHLACQLNVVDSLSLLIKCGANVNVKDADGKTPLQYAVCSGSFDCACALLQNGADVNTIKDGCFDSLHIGKSRSKR